MILDVCIVVLPESLNSLYGIGRGRMFKRPKAVEWAEKASLLIGAADSNPEGYWGEDLPSEGKDIWIFIEVWLCDIQRRDLDNFFKLVQDTTAEKLGFDDKQIVTIHAEKYQSSKEYIRIRLGCYGEDSTPWNWRNF